jgi:hypothetical protein
MKTDVIPLIYISAKESFDYFSCTSLWKLDYHLVKIRVKNSFFFSLYKRGKNKSLSRPPVSAKFLRRGKQTLIKCSFHFKEQGTETTR